MTDKKEKVFNITMTELELAQEIADAENNEDYQLFLRVSNGQRISQKLHKLYSVAEKE